MLEDSKNKISKCQFGGISWSSAVLALLEMLHTWFSALENPQTVMRIIFLDFPRAFDLIVHNILLSNFKSIGALPPFTMVHRSLTEDKIYRCCVWYIKNINTGVPQGSKIGPLAFVAKINNLSDIAITDKSSEKEHVTIFMDDTTLAIRDHWYEQLWSFAAN